MLLPSRSKKSYRNRFHRIFGCAHCAWNPLGMWYRKRARLTSTVAPNLATGRSSAPVFASGSNQPKRRHRGKKKLIPVIRMLLLTSLMVLLFLFTFN